METEKCRFCGASVKRTNLKEHYGRVHPKLPSSAVQPLSPVKPTTFIQRRGRRNAILVVLLVLALVGASVAVQQFVKANTMQMHWHPQVSIVINGSPVTVPAQIGISPSLYIDHSLDQYGMGGMAPLHTHDTSGTVHEESNTARDFTLQEFLAIWGQHLDSSQVLDHPVDAGHRAYIIVDGVEKKDTLDAVFANGQKIQIVCGT